MAQKILVIDDYADMIDSIATLLDLRGLESRRAQSAEEGLQIAGDWQPDTIAVDLWMPKMDGHEFARLIRQRYGKAVNLIAVLRSASAKVYNECAQAGFTSCILKPFAVSELLEKINPDAGCHE